MVGGENVYVRGFGSFVVKKRAKKTARNISKNTAIIIPEHFVPSFNLIQLEQLSFIFVQVKVLQEEMNISL